MKDTRIIRALRCFFSFLLVLLTYFTIFYKSDTSVLDYSKLTRDKELKSYDIYKLDTNQNDVKDFKKSLNNERGASFIDKDKVISQSFLYQYLKINNTLYNNFQANYLNLSGNISLENSKLKNLSFYFSNLEKLRFINCDFDSVVFQASNLSGIFHYNCNFNNVIFIGTNLKNVDFLSCNFKNVCFEPKVLPDLDRIATCSGLDRLIYFYSPEMLFKLKKELETKGYIEAARKVNTSIQRMKNLKADKTVRYVKYVFMDLTYEYGANLSRPIMILVFFILFFGIIYYNINGRIHNSNIILQVSREINNKTIKHSKKISFDFIDFITEIKFLKISFSYSLTRTLRLGIGLFDFSRWFQLIQIREFRYSETGYLRPVSGIQSIISLYLIFLWLKVLLE